MTILADISSAPVQENLKKHWPWFAVGGLAILYLGYAYFKNTSATAATSSATTAPATVDPTTAYNGQVQLQLAGIAAQAQTTLASIQASQAIQTQNIVTAGSNYQTLVNATAVQNNTLVSTAANQNIQMANALSTGFSNYAISTAQIATSESTAAANLGASNNAANGATMLNGALSGVGSIISALNTNTGQTAGGLGSNTIAGTGGGSNLIQTLAPIAMTAALA